MLTEPSEFGGSIAMLQDVAAVVSIPVLAETFSSTRSRCTGPEAGADGVLVIVRILGEESLNRSSMPFPTAGSLLSSKPSIRKTWGG